MEVFLILWRSWHLISTTGKTSPSMLHHECTPGENAAAIWLTGYMVVNVQLYNICTVEVAAWSHLQDLVGLPEATCNNVLIQHCWPWNRRRCIAPSGSCYFAHLGKRLSQAVPWTLTSRCQDTITMALTPCEERVIPEANHVVSQQNDFVYFSFSVFECWVVILTVSLVKGLW